MRRLALSLLLLGALVAGCEPAGREYFVRSDGSGSYAFTLQLSEGSYDFSFFTGKLYPAAGEASFPMEVEWISPSGAKFSETVYYPAGRTAVPYRSGVQPGEAGEWTITVDIQKEPGGFTGLGITYTRR